MTFLEEVEGEVFNLVFFRNNRYRLFGNSFFCATFAF